MEKNEIISVGVNGVMYVFAVAQRNETFQLIELILAIATSVVLLLYRLWKWYKEAKKDGKITNEELKDGINILAEGVEEIKDKAKKGEKDDNQGKDRGSQE